VGPRFAYQQIIGVGMRTETAECTNARPNLPYRFEVGWAARILHTIPHARAASNYLRPFGSDVDAQSARIRGIPPMTTPLSASAAETNAGGIDLGPNLPMSVFTSTKRWNPERIRALAIYCSDGRWGEAFDEFCHKHLQIPRYDRWAVPGGPAWLAPQNDEPGFGQAAREQLDFLVHAHQLERIVLITHYGCAYYAQRSGQPPEECLPVQIEDILAATETLGRWYPQMRLEAYLAMRSGNSLSFYGPSA